MNAAPTVIVFDVNETLSDMSPMGARFQEIGAPPVLAKLWFASLLRDGFALTAAGDNPRFADIGAEVLRGILTDAGIDTYTEDDAGTEDPVAHVMSGMASLGLHPDVTDGIRSLTAAGHRLVTLTNGSTKVAENLFVPAGIRGEFEQLLSVEDAPAWKPARTAYEYAASACGVEPGRMMLVAVHPWDIHGAARAGLRTAWINRAPGRVYPHSFLAPDYTIASLEELAGVLAGGMTVHG